VETIKLPRVLVKSCKENIWSEWHASNSRLLKESYSQLLARISHPAAVYRARVVRGTRSLQYCLNILILLRRLRYLAVMGFAILGITKSWTYLLAALGVLILDYFSLNIIQTNINVELAARLFVLDELRTSSSEFSEIVAKAFDEK